MLRKKLLIKLVIILICGAIALSLPVIVSHMQKPTSASTNPSKGNSTDTTIINTDWQLTSSFVGKQYQDKVDCGIVWQIEQKCGNTVIATWDEIYASITATNPLTYDSEHLILTTYGLVYRGLQTTTDYQALYASGYQSTVIYQNHSCVLTLN